VQWTLSKDRPHYFLRLKYGTLQKGVSKKPALERYGIFSGFFEKPLRS